ncbi:hypothetical protein AMATHDRAFT_123128, partial [Amanita thiersii Skay4041]
YLDVHRGALDHALVTTEPPPAVMKRIRNVLADLCVQVHHESDFKYRCICLQRRPPSPNSTSAVFLPLKSTEEGADEVRFSVELTRLDGLIGTYSLDVRRLKGNLRSYKLLYDTFR